jgi:hypothetical protein
MKRSMIVLLLILAVLPGWLALDAPAARAAVENLRLFPNADGFVDSAAPDAVFDDQTLSAAYSPACTVTRRFYLRFDLALLYEDMGPTTRLRLYQFVPPAKTGTLELYAAGDDWNGAAPGLGDETTLTWNTAPAPGALLDTRTAPKEIYVFHFSGQGMADFFNSQRTANGGDGQASLMVQWKGCPNPAGDSLAFEDRENSGGTNQTPVIKPLDPTAITLVSFTARAPSLPAWLVSAGKIAAALIATPLLLGVVTAALLLLLARKRA